ncbi:cysteine-rich and transmembrane domain-containing protein A [Senna tora]|uniref:Cysteine-rich and transmembrane domain-containing protein A n=1 Tax=Senna tora TaxID=362788 RepID=A0A834TYB1_9FABA|nr:cysteine-rich and transmembrane domain-containing protein A [Senna tora]
MSHYDYHQQQPPVGVPPPQGNSFLLSTPYFLGYPPKDAYPPPAYPVQGYPPPGYPQQGYPQQGYAPQYAQAPPPKKEFSGTLLLLPSGCLLLNEGICPAQS